MTMTTETKHPAIAAFEQACRAIKSMYGDEWFGQTDLLQLTGYQDGNFQITTANRMVHWGWSRGRTWEHMRDHLTIGMKQVGIEVPITVKFVLEGEQS